MAAVVGGAGHDGVEVRVSAVRGPGLRAVDDVVVAVADRAGAQGGRVGSGVRLGEAVGAQQLAPEHLRQPGALLVGAEAGQREAGQHVHGDADRDAGPDGGDLLQDLEIDLVRLARPAVLLGEGQPEQPAVAEGAEDLAREGGVGLRLGDPGDEFLGGEGAGEFDEVDGFLGREDASGRHGGLRGNDTERGTSVSPRVRQRRAPGHGPWLPARDCRPVRGHPFRGRPRTRHVQGRRVAAVGRGAQGEDRGRPSGGGRRARSARRGPGAAIGWRPSGEKRKVRTRDGSRRVRAAGRVPSDEDRRAGAVGGSPPGREREGATGAKPLPVRSPPHARSATPAARTPRRR